jgi:broad specificity phosphatase PhoE
MTRIVLVRHAMPVVLEDLPGHLWQLGEGGRVAARAVRSRLPDPAYLVASDEPKAIDTLREAVAGGEVAVDAGFAEVGRPHIRSGGDDYRAAARAYVGGVVRDGWEPHEAVVARFGRAVRRHAGLAGGRALVIGTHGLCMTLWLAHATALPDPVAFWAGLDFPDVVEVPLGAG